MYRPYLKNCTPLQLAKFWCQLNCFEWPSELGEKPTDYGPQGTDKSGSFIMREIEQIIGIKACLREWNKDRMDDEQFEVFWNKENRNP